MLRMKIILPLLSVFILCIFTPELKSQVISAKPDSLNNNSKTFYKAVGLTSAYYAGSLFILGKTWYKDRDRVAFHFYNDNKGYLQVDKFGHTFGSYVYSYVGFSLMRSSGFSRNEALYYGATLGLILQTPIEIMDGIYEGYGFSWGDMAANTLGSAIVIGQELLFKEQIVKYKFSYLESTYSRNSNGYLGNSKTTRLLKDYNGHTYWLSVPFNKIFHHGNIPKWLCISAGYGANGMYGEFDNITTYNGVDIPYAKRYRQYLLSLDIDWTKIKTNSKLLRVILKGMTFVKLPFPAIEYNSKGHFKGYWLYY